MFVILSASCATKKPAPEVIEYQFDKKVYEDAIAPQIYGIVATRTTNKMLDDTKNIYENLSAPFLYVMEIKKDDVNLPDGFYYSNQITKEILTNSRTFRLVSNMNDADYYLETIVSTYTTPDNESPIIVYKMILFDNKNVKINEWTENVSRIKNDDKTWW